MNASLADSNRPKAQSHLNLLVRVWPSYYLCLFRPHQRQGCQRRELGWQRRRCPVGSARHFVPGWLHSQYCCLSSLCDLTLNFRLSHHLSHSNSSFGFVFRLSELGILRSNSDRRSNHACDQLSYLRSKEIDPYLLKICDFSSFIFLSVQQKKRIYY